MKMQSAINALEKNGFTQLTTLNKQLFPYHKGNAHVTIYKNGYSDQVSMIEVQHIDRVGTRGELCSTIKSALIYAEKYISGEWK